MEITRDIISGASAQTASEIYLGSCVTSIGDSAFTQCSGITSIEIPDTVEAIGIQAFTYCTNLSSVTIGSGVTSIGNCAFCDSYNITHMQIDAITPPSITGATFGGSYGINVPSGSAESYISAWPQYASRIRYEGQDYKVMFYNASDELESSILCNSSSSITNSEVNTNITSNTTKVVFGNCLDTIGGSAFINKNNLTDVTFSDSISGISSSAFYGCTNLTNVIFGSRLENIGNYAFQNCSSLSSITIPSGVTSIGSEAFNNTTINNLTIIGNSSTTFASGAFEGSTYGNVTFGNTLSTIPKFYGCRGFSAVTIPSNITVLPYNTFKNCNDLLNIEIKGNGLTEIGAYAFGDFNGDFTFDNQNPFSNVTSIGSGAFEHCSGVTSIGSLSSVQTIGDYAFSRCSGLTAISINSGVTSIGYDAFGRCSNMVVNLKLSSSLNSIGYGAFSGCSKLNSIDIEGNSATTIGYNAFRDCDTISSARFINASSIGSDVFQNTIVNSLKIGSGVTNYGDAFRRANIKSLTFLDGVTSTPSGRRVSAATTAAARSIRLLVPTQVS